MRVPVVEVGEVPMPMDNIRVQVRMRMRLGAVPVKWMRMLVMLIVPV